MNDFWTALALAMAIEGFAYAIFPDGMKRMMTNILKMPSSKVRSTGLIAAILGVSLIWLIRG